MEKRFLRGQQTCTSTVAMVVPQCLKLCSVLKICDLVLDSSFSSDQQGKLTITAAQRQMLGHEVMQRGRCGCKKGCYNRCGCVGNGIPCWSSCACGSSCSKPKQLVLISRLHVHFLYHILQNDASILQNDCDILQNIPFSILCVGIICHFVK